jgi:hypothetical protein
VPRARGYRLWKRAWRKSAVGERASEPLRAQCSLLGRTCNSKAKRCARCTVLAGEHPLSLCCYGYNLVPYNYPPSRAASSVGLYFALRADLRAIRLRNSQSCSRTLHPCSLFNTNIFKYLAAVVPRICTDFGLVSSNAHFQSLLGFVKLYLFVFLRWLIGTDYEIRACWWSHQLTCACFFLIKCPWLKL